METTLIFATNNKQKVLEIRSVTGNLFEIITLKEAGIDIDIPEPHDTLEAFTASQARIVLARIQVWRLKHSMVSPV
jgi:XTP/dITP diphosphohydrolase